MSNLKNAYKDIVITDRSRLSQTAVTSEGITDDSAPTQTTEEIIEAQQLALEQELADGVLVVDVVANSGAGQVSTATNTNPQPPTQAQTTQAEIDALDALVFEVDEVTLNIIPDDVIVVSEPSEDATEDATRVPESEPEAPVVSDSETTGTTRNPYADITRRVR